MTIANAVNSRYIKSQRKQKKFEDIEKFEILGFV